MEQPKTFPKNQYEALALEYAKKKMEVSTTAEQFASIYQEAYNDIFYAYHKKAHKDERNLLHLDLD